MKKALILTFSKVNNRGANLQCYALKSKLEALGCEVRFMDVPLKSSARPNWKGFIWMYIQNALAESFRKKYGFTFTQPYHSLEALEKNPPQADYYIVGSDQVWNPDLTRETDPRIFFFTFLPENANKIAYAASFGRDSWPHGSYDVDIKKSVSTFKAISVREDTGCTLCKEVFEREDAKLVLDPTLLLTKDEVLKIIGKKPRPRSGIFRYLLHNSSEISALVNRISELTQLNVWNQHTNKLRHNISVSMTIPQWLSHIASSEMVITNSFHCMVFCILLQKPFVVIPPYPGRQTRMTSLLKKLALEERYISDMDDLEKKKDILLQSIDYEKVNRLLSQEREYSMQFLASAIQ